MFDYKVIQERETGNMDYSIEEFAKEGYRVINFSVEKDAEGIFYVALMELERCPNCCRG